MPEKLPDKLDDTQELSGTQPITPQRNTPPAGHVQPHCPQLTNGAPQA